jgi:nitrate reductase molybdenum cofactor assembly chaperone NarJ/NarW
MSKVLQNNLVYELLSTALDYPSQETIAGISRAAQSLSSEEPEAAEQLRIMQAAIADMTLDYLQEIYTRTFDIAPLCVPYLTSYIYGPESFERGDVMAKLAACFETRGFDPGKELPDHVAVLMRFCAQLNDEEISDLVRYCMARPLKDIVETLTDAESVFQYPLIAFKTVLQKRFPEEMLQ